LTAEAHLASLEDSGALQMEIQGWVHIVVFLQDCLRQLPPKENLLPLQLDWKDLPKEKAIPCENWFQKEVVNRMKTVNVELVPDLVGERNQE
jgi:hypothetical protein